MAANRHRPYVKKTPPPKHKTSWGCNWHSPTSELQLFLYPPSIFSATVTRDETDKSPSQSQELRASWKVTQGPELVVILLSLLGRVSASLETFNCFLAVAQENKCWLSFRAPLSCILHSVTLWHHTQRSWMAGSMGPRYAMSPDLVQISPHCWGPTCPGMLLGSCLCRRAWIMSLK